MRLFAVLAIVAIVGAGCASDPASTGQVMQIVKLRTSLDDAGFLRIAHQREPSFAANPAIIQKYYIKLNEPGYYGGVYIWESADALRAFKESALAASIPTAYSGVEKPSVEVVDILFQLRE